MRLRYKDEFLLRPIADVLALRGWDVAPSTNPGEDLIEGRADLVLAPALDYGRFLGLVDYSLVPGFGVTARGFAGIMKVVFNTGLGTISTLAVRNAHSAATLIATIILVEKHGIEPQLVEVEEDADISVMLEVADGALLTGDEAIFASPTLTNALDLADEWEDITEHALPYALAWGKTGRIPQAVLDEFLKARDEAVLTLADRTSGHEQAELAAAFYQRYLRGDIAYSLPEEEANDVLTPIFHYAFYHGIINDIPAIKYLPGEDSQTATEESGEIS